MSSEREERYCWMQEEEEIHAAIVKVFSKAFFYHCGPLLPCTVFEYDFDCHAGHSQPWAHPHAATAAEGPGDLVRNLLLKKDIIQASLLCPHAQDCVAFGAPCSLEPAHLRPGHISHPVANQDLELKLCLKFYLTDNPSVHLVSFFYAHMFVKCTNWHIRRHWLSPVSAGTNLDLENVKPPRYCFPVLALRFPLNSPWHPSSPFFFSFSRRIKGAWVISFHSAQWHLLPWASSSTYWLDQPVQSLSETCRLSG